MSYQSFLMVNPHIQAMLNNDTSLANIATVNNIRNINLGNTPVPKLYNDNDINFSSTSMDTMNYIKLLLFMIINLRTEYSLNYRNLGLSQQQAESLTSVVTSAFKIGHSKYIEYFSGIKSVSVNIQTKSLNNVVVEINLVIKLIPHYDRALYDTARYLRMSQYVKHELLRTGKIHSRMSQKDIAKILYNWVVLHVTYDDSFQSTSYSGHSALYNGLAVCQGITALYNTLCKLFGLNIVGMSGQALNSHTGQQENHIWSFALLDNQQVYMDSTWGIPRFKDPNTLVRNGINPKLLCDFSEFDIPYWKLEQERTWNKEIYG